MLLLTLFFHAQLEGGKPLSSNGPTGRLLYQMPHIPRATIYHVAEPQKANFEFLVPPTVVLGGWWGLVADNMVASWSFAVGASWETIKCSSMLQAVDGPKK